MQHLFTNIFFRHSQHGDGAWEQCDAARSRLPDRIHKLVLVIHNLSEQADCLVRRRMIDKLTVAVLRPTVRVVQRPVR